MGIRRVLLFATLIAVGVGWILEVDAAGKRSIARSDCSFLRSPDTYLGAAGRRQRDISVVTDEVTAQLLAGRVEAIEEIPYHNFIDQFIFDRMRRDRIPHPGLVNDEQFLRRVTLDLTGRTPTPDEVRAFLQNSSPDKREQWIDSLMASPEYIDRWTLFFGDLYRNTAASTNVTRYFEGRNGFHRYLQQALRDKWPYNDFVTTLITANGSNFDTSPVNWLANGVTPGGPLQDMYDTLAVNTATQFLGVSHLDCLLCHNGAGHLTTLSLWGSKATRMQAWGMSAFYSKISLSRPGTGNVPYIISESTATGSSYNLNTNFGNRTNRVATDGVTTVQAAYMFGPTAKGGTNNRDSLARSVVTDRQFARATVNYLWAELMGMGIVDPPDSFDMARLDSKTPLPAPWTVQPSNPALLEALTDDFINSGFALQQTIRQIVTSSAYQLSARFPGKWKPQYTQYFARHFVRRLKAEEVLDAVVRATGTTTSYTVRGFDQPVAWAMQLPDSSEPQTAGVVGFLTTFLRGNRDNIFRSDEITIPQTLALMNDNLVVPRTRANTATTMIRKLIAAGHTDPQLVEDLYLTALSRFPTPEERATALKSFAGKEHGAACEDLLWVLLNKVDFVYNY